MKVCLYCEKAYSHFADEHVLPMGFGGFKGALILQDRICRDCNSRLSVLEQELLRHGPEAIIRWLHNIYSRRKHKNRESPFIVTPRNPDPIRLMARDPLSGELAFFAFEKGSRKCHLLNQMYLIDDAGRRHHLCLPEPLEHWRQVMPVFQKCGVQRPLRNLLYLTREDPYRAHWIVSNLVAGSIIEPVLGARDEEVRIEGEIEVEVGDGYFRAIAKIAFHHLLHRLCLLLTGFEMEFQGIRDYIRYGGQRKTLIRTQADPWMDVPLNWDERSSGIAIPRKKHLTNLIHLVGYRPNEGNLESCVTLFYGRGYFPLTHIVNLGPSPLRTLATGEITRYVYANADQVMNDDSIGETQRFEMTPNLHKMWTLSRIQ